MAIFGKFATASARGTLHAAMLFATGLVGAASPALAQCVAAGVDKVCSNTGVLIVPPGAFGISSASGHDNLVTNSGSIIGTLNNFGISAAAAHNNVITNTGTISVDQFGISAAAGNSNIITNFGTVSGGAFGMSLASNNNVIVNAGTIAGGTFAISAAGNNFTLTSLPGSRIVGAISVASTASSANFLGGNYLYSGLGGSIVTTNGSPFVSSGGSIAVLDPTALGLEDRSVMNFTAGVSSMLKDRFNGMPVASGAAGGAMGFAPDAASRMDAAHDAFAGIPSVSMPYSSTEAKKSNANAMYTKAPALAAPVYDTVVWASGFGGERRQWENGTIQRATDNAYGGAIGVDRQFTPDLRLGAFVGGGNSKLSVAYNLQTVDSDYVFGGGYGRWDKHNYYIDFALFGGGLSSNSTRQISNNLVANGLEIATASYHGWFISPDVTYGYRYFMGDYVITPKARVRYVGGSLDGYTETGSAQGLSIGKRNLSDIEERLGVEFASVRPVTIGGTLKSSVEVSGIGLQRLGDNTINAVLLAQNLAFTTPGSSQAFGGVVNLGLDWRPKSNVSVYASVEATAMNDNSFSATGKGGVRVGF
jgi:outer membrane autotransporter protein